MQKLTILQVTQVKTYKSSEIKKLEEIHRQCFLSPYNLPWNEQTIYKTLQQRYCIGLKATYKQEHIVGFIVAALLFDHIDILTLAVIPDYQRQGIATSLLEYLFKLHSDKDVFLEVEKINTAAIALYKKMGFVKLGERKNYYKNFSSSEKKDAIAMYRSSA